MKRARPRARKPAARSVPATVAETIRAVAARLKRSRVVLAHGTTDPVSEAAFLVAETLGIHPDHISVRSGMLLTPAQQQRIAALVERRIRTRKPAAYLLKRIYMQGVPFYIDERALVPRSYLGEILGGELLAGDRYALIRNPVRRVLDLCTGSGCLAILAALRFPQARVDAVELSNAALAVARRNVGEHRLGKRVRLLRGDLFAPVKTGRYDLIVANPPYVDRSGMATLPPECRYEPRMALDGGPDGLAVIRRIIEQARRHLKPGGGLLCEIGRGRSALERAYPRLPFLWLDTAESSGEVFWLDASELPG